MTTLLAPVEPPSEPPVAAPPVRVLHAINGEYYSGAERVQDLLAQWLPETGFAVGFACLKPDRFPAMRQSRMAPLYELPMRGKLDLRVACQMANLVRREGYALIHAHTPRSVLVARLAAARAKVPLVYHVHSPAARDSTRGWIDRVNARVERACLLGAARLIAVSRSLGRHMVAEGFPDGRIAVVPNGVPSRAEPLPWTRPPRTWTLGMVALFRPRKGLEVLLEALARLRREGHFVHLRAIGPFETSAYQDAILQHAARLGLEEHITWTGFTSDVAAELARIDLFVLPSLFGEGLPMVVLEAMAAGIPVVATRVEGVPEAIRDGIDGLLADPGDPASLSRALGQVVCGEVDGEALRQSAFARQRAAFSARSMAAGVAAVYRELLEQRAIPA